MIFFFLFFLLGSSITSSLSVIVSPGGTSSVPLVSSLTVCFTDLSSLISSFIGLILAVIFACDAFEHLLILE